MDNMKVYKIHKNESFPKWNDIESLDDFIYPWKNKIRSKTVFQAYYDDENIYFRFLVDCIDPKFFVKDNNKLEVIHSERVEIFFRKDESMNPYYCLEIDPLSRVLDYKAQSYRNFDRTWKWPESLCVKSEISEKKYSVEAKIKISTLEKLELIKGNQIEIGLYRGNCIELEEDKAVINWISWVDPKTESPDFHVASSFGLLQLESN